MTKFDLNVILDMFLTTTTFTLVAVGMGAAALAGFEMIGSWGYLVGLASVLGSIGWGVTKVAMNPDKAVEESLSKRRERELKAKEEALNAFDKKLTDNQDWDVRRPFREMRAVYNEFRRLYPSIMEGMREEMERQYMELFDTCLSSLSRAHDSLMSIRAMEVDRVKKPLLDRRNKAIQNVRDSIEQMTSYVTGIAEADDKNDELAMTDLHASFQSNLDVLREADEEMRDFMSSKVAE